LVARYVIVEYCGVGCRDVGEGNTSLEESLHGDFVGGIQDGGSRLAGGEGLECKVEAGEALAVRDLEIEAGAGGEVETRQVEGEALGMGQGHRNGHAHVGETQLRQDRRVDVLHQRVHDGLGVHHDVDALGRYVEEPASLDDLETLVHERRRIDRDLRSHVPVRVVERLFHRRPGDLLGTPGAKGPTRRRQDQAAHTLGLRIGKGLEDRTVLTVYRQEVDARALHLPQHQRTRHNHHFFVRQRDVATRSDGGQRRHQPDSTDETRHDQIGVVDGHGLEALGTMQNLDRVVAQQAAKLARTFGIAHRNQCGPKALHLRGHHVDLAAGCESGDFEGLWTSGDHAERLLTDAPGAPQDGKPLHPSSPARPRT
jgi:hypothetical protein